jgi:hypothetical protein
MTGMLTLWRNSESSKETSNVSLLGSSEFAARLWQHFGQGHHTFPEAHG